MSLPTYVEIPVGEIGPGPKVRAERIDLDHVARLRLAIDSLPPIVVRQGPKGWALVDGQHRLSAHKFEERATIRCEVVELDDAQAFARAVESNLEHGLFLSLGERKSAAAQILGMTEWSDVRIAGHCGISPKTVASMRPAQPRNPERLDSQKREGNDGRSRPTPTTAAANRAKVADYIKANPDHSLRTIADACGVSPETARSVRDARPAPPTETPHGKAPGGEPTPRPALAAVKPPATAAGVSVGEVVTWWPSPGDWHKTDGFEVSNASRDFARIMDRRVPREPESIAKDCPARHRTGAAAAARQAATWWSDIATALEAESRPEAVEA